jgi:hypothetical protein
VEMLDKIRKVTYTSELNDASVHLFANVGFTPEAIIPSIRSRPDLETVFLFYDKKKEAKDAAAKIADVAKALKIKVTHRIIDTVFDSTAAFQTYLETYKSLPEPRRVVFNTAGGPGVMVSVATAFAILMNIPLFHVRRDNKKEEEFPTAAVWLKQGWSPKHREVLRAVFDGNRTQPAIVKATGMSTGYVSKILTQLENGGFLKAELEGRERVVSYAPLTKLIFEADEFKRDESETWATNLRNYIAHMPDADPNLMRRRIEQALRLLSTGEQAQLDRRQGTADVVFQTPAGRIALEVKHRHLDDTSAGSQPTRRSVEDWRKLVRAAFDRHLEMLEAEVNAETEPRPSATPH